MIIYIPASKKSTFRVPFCWHFAPVLLITLPTLYGMTKEMNIEEISNFSRSPNPFQSINRVKISLCYTFWGDIIIEHDYELLLIVIVFLSDKIWNMDVLSFMTLKKEYVKKICWWHLCKHWLLTLEIFQIILFHLLINSCTVCMADFFSLEKNASHWSTINPVVKTS